MKRRARGIRFLVAVWLLSVWAWLSLSGIALADMSIREYDTLAAIDFQSALAGPHLQAGGIECRVIGRSIGAWVHSKRPVRRDWAGMYAIQIAYGGDTWHDSYAYSVDVYGTELLNVNMPSCGNVGLDEVNYILQHFYPQTGEPSRVFYDGEYHYLNANEKAAAVQAAIWYFTNRTTMGADTHYNITEGYYQVCNAARNGTPSGIPVVPQQMSASPPSAIRDLRVDPQHTVNASVIGSNGLSMAGVTVNFEVVSGPHTGRTGSAPTDASGVATWTYDGSAPGTDVIQIRTAPFSVPTGLEFCSPGYMTLGKAGHAVQGMGEASALVTWEGCPAYTVQMIAHQVDCTSGATEYIYRVTGSGGPDLTRWSLEIPVFAAGDDVTAVDWRPSSGGEWTSLSAGSDGWLIRGTADPENRLVAYCGDSLRALEINATVSDREFRITVSGLYGTTAGRHWAGEAGSAAQGLCTYCEAGLEGPSAQAYQSDLALVCPDSLTVSCRDEVPSPDLGTLQYSGGNGQVTLMHVADTSDGLTCPETITRQYRAQDECGTQVSCEQEIVIWDTVPPTLICPDDVSIACGDEPDPATTGRATASDNCDVQPTVSFTDETAPGTCGQTRIIRREWVATDACENRSSSCVQTITEVDSTPPQLVCPADLTVEAGDPVPDPDVLSVQADDDCGSVTVTHVGDESDGRVCPETITRRYRGVDACGNVSECIQRIRIADTTPPTISCPPLVEINADDPIPPADVETVDARDNSGQVTVSHVGDQSDEEFCPETITRVYRAVDPCGNEATCSQTIRVADTTPPSIVCPGDITIDSRESLDPSHTGAATATDNRDPSPVIEYSDRWLDGACPSVLERTWTATDACGLHADCVQRITVEDTTPPVIICPEDVTVECGDSTEPSDTGSATATDTVDPNPTVTYTDSWLPGACASVLERTWIATDACDLVATCVQRITVVDTTPPVIVCPAEKTIECGESTDPTHTGSATATDGCDPNPFVTHQDHWVSGGCPAVLERTWTATDACDLQSSCVQVITIEDTTRPVITCPAAVTIECGDSLDPEATGMATATDTCDPNPTITHIDRWLEGNGPSVLERSWTATDACDLVATCVQRITVVDTTAPVIVCPPAATVECGGSMDPADTGSATVSDACDTNPLVTYEDHWLDDTCPSIVERTWTATDACGHWSTCVQVITVQDTLPPAIVPPADKTISCDESRDPTHTGTATATDVCDPAPKIEYSDQWREGTCPSVFDRTWVATDACGLASVSVQVITVVDTTPPVLTCPADVTIECGTSSQPTATGQATATDTCDTEPVVTYTDNWLSGRCPSVLERTWIATDACEQQTRRIQTITVVDTTPPVITCPEPVTVECGDSVEPDITGVPTVTDACDPSPDVWHVDSEPYGDCPKQITRTWSATDACGNASETCIQIITLEDTTPPVLACPPPLTISCAESTAPENTGYATVQDACDPNLEPEYVDERYGSCPITLVRTWYASDTCHNDAVPCQQIITLVDDDPPVVTCPPDITIEYGASMSPYETGNATATDTCDLRPPVSYSDGAVQGPYPFQITRTWSAIDQCGNTGACEQTITLVDTTPPTIVGPTELTVQCIESMPLPDIGSLQVTDRLDQAPSVEWVGDADDEQSCPKTITRTYRATDSQGNEATFTQRIIVHDTVDPQWDQEMPTDGAFACDDVPSPPSISASDNCATSLQVQYEQARIEGDCPDHYVLVRTWRASDGCGNDIEHVQTLTVGDSTAPEWDQEMPADVVVPCDAVPQAPTVAATDNCGDVDVAFVEVREDGSCQDSYTLLRTWVAADECGNSAEHVQTITVQDTAPPEWNQEMPDDLAIECGETIPDVPEVFASDGCAPSVDVVFHEEMLDGDCPSAYTLVRTWSATDDCGNTVEHVQTIEVRDTLSPTWDREMPGDAFVECDAVPSPVEVSASDICDETVDVVFVEQRVDGECPNRYTLYREWSASDTCGNRIVHTQAISVTDSTAPVWDQAMPADSAVECDRVPDAPQELTASDDCGTAFVTFAETQDEVQCEGGHVLLRTWTAVDACGNQATHTQRLTVVDTMAPVFAVCPTDRTVCADQSLVAVVPDLVTEAIAVDNCSTTLTVTQAPAADTLVGPGEHAIVLTAIDDCGNVASCQTGLTVSTGQVWVSVSHDLDADGADVGDEGLSGWEIALSNADGVEIGRTTTDGAGEARFSDLGCGVYRVTMASKTGWIATTAAEQTVNVEAEQTATARFGCFHCVTVYGSVWRDSDGDGLWDEGESPVEGWPITLSGGPSGGVQTTETRADGGYAFAVCEPGEYIVSEAHRDGWAPITPDEVSMVVASGEDVGPIDFGNYDYFYSLGAVGRAFWDLDRNGLCDEGEPGLPGVTIIVRDSEGNEVYRTETADIPAPGRGQWTIAQPLAPGVYTVEEVVPAGWQRTAPDTNGGVYQIRLLPEDTFELLSPEPSGYAGKLSFGNARRMGCVFCDLAANAQRDPEDELLANWPIVIKDMDLNIVYATTTDGGGCWWLERALPEGDYYVVEAQDPEWTQTYPENFAGGYKIHLDADGGYTLLSQQPSWFDGLSFGNSRFGGGGVCPLCPEWVVFQSDRDSDGSGTFDIYRMRFDGSDVWRLTNAPADDTSPTWCYDGVGIAYASRRDGDWEIYRMMPDGDGQRNVTRHPDADDVAPSWGCDRIAFQSNRDGNWEIYAGDPDGIEQVRLTSHPARDEAPAWSPDERWLAFQSDRQGHWDIYIMDSNGANLRRLTDDVGEEKNPTWSIDQQWVIYASNRDGNVSLYQTHLETGETTRLTAETGASDTHAALMPYCDRMLFQREQDGEVEIYALSDETEEPVNLSMSPGACDALDHASGGGDEGSEMTVVLCNGVDGYAGMVDTTLDAWEPTACRGSEHSVRVRGEGVRGAAMRFDVSGLPADKVIQSARLEMRSIDRTNANALKACLYPLSCAWDEASATYQQSADGVPWAEGSSVVGCLQESGSSAMIDSVDTLVTWDVTALVRSWATGSEANHGFVLMDRDDTAVEYSLVSSEHGNTAWRPRLVVVLRD